MLSQRVEPFTCNVTPERDRVIVAPRGELDMATVQAVEGELQRLFELTSVIDELPFRTRP